MDRSWHRARCRTSLFALNQNREFANDSAAVIAAAELVTSLWTNRRADYQAQAGKTPDVRTRKARSPSSPPDWRNMSELHQICARAKFARRNTLRPTVGTAAEQREAVDLDSGRLFKVGKRRIIFE